MQKHFVTRFSQDERTQLRAELDHFVSEKAVALGRPEEAVVQEVRYWQQSAAKGHTNPTATQRRLSFEHWKNVCAVCGERIESLDKATFHHLKRGIPNQHAPENMQPLHRNEPRGCHEKIHGVPVGSLTAGSMRRKS
jgi:hypothetical protein